MRLALSILVLLAACGDDANVSPDAQPDATECVFPARDCGGGQHCTLGSTDCCSGACTSCDWLGVTPDPPAEDGDSCSISDWEHDFSCRYYEPEAIWLCCGTAGCQYGDCPTELGEPCCAGDQSASPYVCTDGRWVDPLS